MRRIDRYVLAEMLVPALVGGVLVLMLLVGNQLYGLLKYLYQGVPARDVLLALLYFVPGVLVLAIPAALLLGAALGLNRLERDREILSMRMAGVRLKRAVLPILLLGIVGGGIIFYLQEQVIPYTTHQALQLTRQLALGSPAAVVQPDTVMTVGDYFIYVRSTETAGAKQILRGVVVIQKSRMGSYPILTTIPVAENVQGRWTFKTDPVTGETFRTYFPDKNGEYSLVEGTTGKLNLSGNLFAQASDQRSTPEEFTFRELYTSLKTGVRGTIGYGLSNGMIIGRQQLLFYLNRKIAVPLSALVAILIAVPLSIHFGRAGGYVGLLLSVVVAFCFIVSQQWTQVLADTNRLQPIIAAWAPNVFFGLLGVVLLLKEE